MDAERGASMLKEKTLEKGSIKGNSINSIKLFDLVKFYMSEIE
jgi:hypothetical protein